MKTITTRADRLPTIEGRERNPLMTTIDHQQAAVEAMTVDFRPSPYLNSDQNDEQRSAYWVAMRDKLAAATPHLRAETVDQLKNFHNDYQYTYAIPGDPYAEGYLTACKAIIALLEGGGE